ncbi:MAG TPA: nitroreductase family deazaflavin-dependent oxidoreductase [Actinomycetota bacterium]|nr:nitroreductase family deazaflavin-dependent oxidoreductase [Actinomycetota bacterium]
MTGARRGTAYHRAAQWLTARRPGVYALRHIFTPLDKLVLRLSRGRRSLLPRAIPGMVLTTTGRKTGKRHATPVLYLEDDGRYVVVASNYGNRKHPGWSYNLAATPRASVQIGDGSFEVAARRATPEEFRLYWPRLVELWPGWKMYRTMTDREFRMFVLERRDDGEQRASAG